MAQQQQQNAQLNAPHASGDVTVRPFEARDVDVIKPFLETRMWLPTVQRLLDAYLLSTKAIALYGGVCATVVYMRPGVASAALSALTLAGYLATVKYVLPRAAFRVLVQPQVPEYAQGFDKYWVDSAGRCKRLWVAEVNGQVVGCAGLRPMPKGAYKHAVFGDVTRKLNRNTAAATSDTAAHDDSSDVTTVPVIRTAYVTSFAVSERHGRQGVGRRLMNHMTSYCRDNDFDTVILHTNLLSTDAVNFYHKVGFKDVEYLSTYTVTMRLEL